MSSIKPRARTTRLVTREVGDELLVYDLERHKAYCLNAAARHLFDHCDGGTTVPEIAVRVGKALGHSIGPRIVRLGLLRLEKARLLDTPVARTFTPSRRDMLRTLGKAALVGIPVVTALSVPTAAQAASCVCGRVFSGQQCGTCFGTCGRMCSKTCTPGGKCR
jgi:hypothetical protein